VRVNVQHQARRIADGTQLVAGHIFRQAKAHDEIAALRLHQEPGGLIGENRIARYLGFDAFQADPEFIAAGDRNGVGDGA
jgi:hypothetical protein